MAAREAARRELLLQSKRKVLVADDGLINRVVLCQILKRQGIEVLECTTGLEAVQAFKQHGLAWPDSLLCILLDINMPHMDGLEAAQRIRQLEAQAAGGKPRWGAGKPAAQGSADLELSLWHSSRSHAGAYRRIPIWAVSACSESEQRCSPALAHLPADLHAGPPWRLAGIDAFMSKPIDSHHLTEMLARLEADLSARQPQPCLPAGGPPTSEAEVRRWPGERQVVKRSLGPGCTDAAPEAKRVHASLEGPAAERADPAGAHASAASLFGGALINPSDSDPEAGAVPALPSDRLIGSAVTLLVPDGAPQAAGPQDYSDEESP